jgi:hypothetical protein
MFEINSKIDLFSSERVGFADGSIKVLEKVCGQNLTTKSDDKKGGKRINITSLKKGQPATTHTTHRRTQHINYHIHHHHRDHFHLQAQNWLVNNDDKDFTIEEARHLSSKQSLASDEFLLKDDNPMLKQNLTALLQKTPSIMCLECTFLDNLGDAHLTFQNYFFT